MELIGRLLWLLTQWVIWGYFNLLMLRNYFSYGLEVCQVMSVPVPTSVHYFYPLVQHLPAGISSNGNLLSQAKRARSAPSLTRSSSLQSAHCVQNFWICPEFWTNPEIHCNCPEKIQKFWTLLKKIFNYI